MELVLNSKNRSALSPPLARAMLIKFFKSSFETGNTCGISSSPLDKFFELQALNHNGAAITPVVRTLPVFIKLRLFIFPPIV